MLNLFKKPINKSDFESWSKMSDDIAKVAILAIPVILYGKDSIAIKCLNTVLLGGAIYLFLVGGRLFREKAKGGK
ncbi:MULTISPECIES: hypothetical protein [unclassified Avibacterium]|uniref:hypothetical protein n=1 Tax=unclassified Avibacterium TaxID=2685287 RepID=UPI002027402E|nr:MULTISPECIES: hypothetical protein [unclassified Avibacterium]MCW9718107.1 hypothetical protein [Avibacterium sp. 21-599]MCW9733946.1 hypothetical protein [Avibacterium sp. 20-15]URL03899.1 hypothetical protein L4F93_10115 [Avibacterium sp. 20-132]